MPRLGLGSLRWAEAVRRLAVQEAAPRKALALAHWQLPAPLAVARAAAPTPPPLVPLAVGAAPPAQSWRTAGAKGKLRVRSKLRQVRLLRLQPRQAEAPTEHLELAPKRKQVQAQPGAVQSRPTRPTSCRPVLRACRAELAGQTLAVGAFWSRRCVTPTSCSSETQALCRPTPATAAKVAPAWASVVYPRQARHLYIRRAQQGLSRRIATTRPRVDALLRTTWRQQRRATRPAWRQAATVASLLFLGKLSSKRRTAPVLLLGALALASLVRAGPRAQRPLAPPQALPVRRRAAQALPVGRRAAQALPMRRLTAQAPASP